MRAGTALLLAALLGGSALATPYTVQKGDTLYRLARSVGLSVTQLQERNGLTSAELRVGQVLDLPVPPGSPPPAQPPVQPQSPFQAQPQPSSLPLPAVPAPAGTSVRISRPGCCANAQWTPDGTQLRVLDQPAGGATGLYRLPADGSAPGGVFERATALVSPDGAYALEPLGPSSAVARRLADGARATVPTGGGGASWSPGGQLAWATYGKASRDDWIPLTVFVTSPFSAGATPQRLPTVYGGRLIGWLDAATVLLTGRLARDDAQRAVLKIDVRSRKMQVLARGMWLSGVRASPDGRRVVYRVTLDTPGRNGMFVVDTATAAVAPLALFGSARWQDPDHLLLIPFEPGQASQRLVQLDVVSGGVAALLSLQDKVTQDDWQVSPDGQRVVYLSQGDRALHVLTLPAPEIPPLPALPAQPAPPLLEPPTLPPPVPVVPPAPANP